MLRGMQIAGRGMTVQMAKSDIVANNLANADTTGFKRDAHTVESFKEVLMDRIEARPYYGRGIGYLGFGSSSGPVTVDFSHGVIHMTENPLDLAIEGDGFFVIETPAGIALTRDGSFALSSLGELVTKDGYRVLGDSGAIQIPQGEFTVGRNGDLFVDGENVGTLVVWKVDDESALSKQGANLYRIGSDVSTQEIDNPNIMQGCLERSNVNVVREMLEMIVGMRNFEACQRVLHSYDTTLDKCVNEVGRV
jgi:flagellar basal-body rod protein FlgF